MLHEINVLILALLSGIVPALFWLWFWVREDKLKPEPKMALLSSFMGGIVAVFLALFFQLIIYYLLVDANSHNLKDLPNILLVPLQNLADKYHLLDLQANIWSGIQEFVDKLNFLAAYNIDAKRFFLVVIIAPVVEEVLKLVLTYNICLRRKINDEPIDASIYMLTAALGFAAVETALFLTGPFDRGTILDGIISGNFRSIGPMLIHLIASAIIGLFIGFAFYQGKISKFLHLVAGLALAILIHATYNFFIMLNNNTHNTTYFWAACIGTWLLVIVLLIFFEKIKKVSRTNSAGK